MSRLPDPTFTINARIKKMNSPGKRLRQPGLVVYFSGVGTSALVLWLVHYLNESQQFNVMGWYVNGILPVGALFVGVASGAGYAIASRLLQVKLSKTFVVGMITTAIIDYFAAQYLTYTHILERLHLSADRYTFVDYIRNICEQMSFRDAHSDKPGSALGMFGYFFKLLEIGGYALGASWPSAMVFGMPYCKGCQRYLKPYRTAYVNSPDLWSSLKRLSKKERIEKLQGAVAAIIGRARQITAAIANAPLAETATAVAALDGAIRKDAAARITFDLKKCPGCDSHHLKLTLTNFTAGKQLATRIVANLDKTKQPAAE